MGQKPKHDDEIIALREQGLSGDAVADQLGITRQTVYNCMRRHGLQGKFRANKALKRRENRHKTGKNGAKTSKKRANLFSVLVRGEYEFIDIRVLPTALAQARRLVSLLEEQGGDVVFEDVAI